MPRAPRVREQITELEYNITRGLDWSYIRMYDVAGMWSILATRPHVIYSVLVSDRSMCHHGLIRLVLIGRAYSTS